MILSIFGGRKGYTFTIYIDLSKIKGSAFKIFSSIIISHEVCHFAYYYELFINLGANTGMVAHSNFTHTVCGTLKGTITKEQDSTSQTIFDEHNIKELIKTFGKYDENHFARGNKTEINYPSMFKRFLKRLGFL